MSATENLRAEIAQRIAALIADSGMSWTEARARAREEFGGCRGLPAGVLPSGSEIETAVRAHYALFAPEEHARVLRRKRELALNVLSLFEGFEASLTGAVLNGAAGVDSPVCLQVFTEIGRKALAFSRGI